MSGNYSRNKGAGGEREAVNLLKENNISAKRISMMETGGIDKGDIKVEDKIGSVKRGQQVPKFLYKSIENADYLFCRRDNEKWLVTLRLHDFVNLLNKLRLDNNA